MTGTVFDIGYQGYTGEREGRNRGRRAIFKDGVRAALGLGRGGKAMVLPWFFIAALSLIATVMALIVGAANTFGGQGTAEQMNLPSHSDYNGIASIVMFVFAAVIAPELLCRDKRDRVINLYLVRPLTGTDYVVSRWAAFLAVMTVAVIIPQIILFLGLSASAPVPLDYLTAHWTDIPKFVAAGIVMALYTTTISMLTASFTSRRAYASVFLVGLFVITAPFVFGLSQELGGAAGQWVSMFSLTNIPVHVNDVIFGDISEITKEAPAHTLPHWILVTWYFAWVLVPGLILWVRYRRLTP